MPGSGCRPSKATSIRRLARAREPRPAGVGMMGGRYGPRSQHSLSVRSDKLKLNGAQFRAPLRYLGERSSDDTSSPRCRR